MLIIITTLVFSVLLLVFYVIFILSYKKYVNNQILQAETEQKEKHIIKFVSEEKREEVREKLDQISEIMVETEKEIESTVKKKVEIAKTQSELSTSEEEIIDKAGKEYRVFTAGLRSALPKTKDELGEDITILEEAIKKLESLDESYYEDDSKKANVGVGMFYEKMSRKFNSLIEENNLNQFSFIPSQRLVYLVFSEVKNIKENDFLPILELMKRTSLLKNLIEINPSFYIIGFQEDIEFSNPEKVILNLIYEEKDLTVQKLIEIAGWDFTYADKIIESMKKREILSVDNENINIKSFGKIEDREKWNELIDERRNKEKIKEEEKRKKQLERRAKLKSKLTETKTDKEKIIESSDSIEEPSQVKFGKKPSVKTLPKVKKDESSLKLPLDFEVDDKEDLDIKDVISQKILSFHENFSLLNGGFSQYEKIKEFLQNEINEISDENLLLVLEQLIELKLISNSVKIGKKTCYLFKEIELTKDEISFIKYAFDKKPLTKDTFRRGLKWNEAKVLETMTTLQEKGILRIESNNVIIPGIQQKGYE